MKKVRILGIDYDIKELNIYKTSGGTNIGHADFDNCVIQLDKDQNDTHKQSILLHELIHILSYRLNLNLDEDAVVRFEAGLFAVFMDNPRLLEEMLELSRMGE